MRTKTTGLLVNVFAVFALTLSSAGYANPVVESPTAARMVADAVIARPVLLATTLGGAAAYIVSLPFSLAGGNAEEAAEVLVKDPARYTFVRCLGCVASGRSVSDTIRQE